MATIKFHWVGYPDLIKAGQKTLKWPHVPRKGETVRLNMAPPLDWVLFLVESVRYNEVFSMSISGESEVLVEVGLIYLSDSSIPV